MPEGKEEEQEIENLFEKNTERNFPNSVKEIDIQVQEAQRLPKKLDLKRTTPRHIVIKMPKAKNKERICLNMFIDYAITVVPFPPLHSTPSCPPPPSHIPPPIVHVHGSYL